MSMATTLCRMVTYSEGFPPIKSHDPIATWSLEITGQTKTYPQYHNVYDHKVSRW